MRQKVAMEVISFVFVVVFVYAAVAKLLEYEKFVIQVGQSPLLTAYGNWVPWLVPTVEIAIALLFLIQRFRSAALYASFTLMVMFTAYIVAILNFSYYVPCSCGGILETLGWTEHLLFNLMLTALSAAGVVMNARIDRSRPATAVLT